MLPPPRLTARERDCLPLLVSGKTRQEIADALDVSVETVKKHVRNLLTKYDAVNIRDVLPTLRLHWEYYYSEHASFDVFCTSAEYAVTIDRHNTEMRAEIVQDFMVVGSQVSSLRFSTTADKFPMRHIEIDGRVPTLLSERAGRMVFESPIYPPADPLTDFRRSSVVIYHMPDPNCDGHYAVLCTYPTQFLTLDVGFLQSNRPDHIDAAVYLHSQKVLNDQFDVIQTPQGMRLTSHNPGFQKSYVVSWKW